MADFGPGLITDGRITTKPSAPSTDPRFTLPTPDTKELASEESISRFARTLESFINQYIRREMGISDPLAARTTSATVIPLYSPFMKVLQKYLLECVSDDEVFLVADELYGAFINAATTVRTPISKAMYAKIAEAIEKYTTAQKYSIFQDCAIIEPEPGDEEEVVVNGEPIDEYDDMIPPEDEFPPPPPPYVEEKPFPWMYVAIGGGALALFLLLRKK